MIQAKLLLSRPFIKINACLIGYGLWLILSQHHIITRYICVPVCFYKIPRNIKLTATDSIDIALKAPKKAFQHYDTEQLAIHLDLSQFTPGTHHIVLQKENLFLPDEVNLINLTPSVIQVQLEKIE